MHVAHFIHRYPPALGGSEAYFARLGRFLTERGAEVTVFTTTAFDLEGFWDTRGRCLRPGESILDGVTVRRYPPWRCFGLRYAMKLLSFLPHRTWQCLTLPCNPVALGMWRAAGRTDPPFDLVHATAFPYGWVLASARRLARRLRVPFVVTPFLHLGDPNNPRDRTARAYLAPGLLSVLHDADRVFVQTAVERDALLAHGVPAGKLILQGLGVDPAECTGGDRRRARREWKVAAEDVVIGHLANLSPDKGSIDLLRAAERAWQAGATFRLVLAGPQMPRFQRFWHHYRSRDRVVLLGPLSHAQKLDFFAGLDVFALPSRSDSFGLVLLEAWANGVPNVAYRAGGVAGVIRHGEDGLLVPCGDVGGLAAALTRLAADAPLRRRLGTAGQARLGRDYRWEDKLDLVWRVYRELVCPSHQPGAPATG